ncbi:MAG: glycerate kinase [Dermatophilaceae bacterium]
MRIVIAPDCFTGTLTAGEAAEAVASGWARSAPHDELVCVPLSDGGPGFVDVLAASLGGQPLALTVSDPLGRPVPATVLVVEDAGTRTAYVESAQACGLHLLAQAERDPRRTSTYGVGEMVLAAVEHGAGRIVVGLGGSGTNDAGAGLLAALGVGSPERLARGGLALDQVARGDLAGLDAATDRLRDVELVCATDVDTPLLGLQGASAIFGPQKGASPDQVQALEAALGHFADVVRRTTPEERDLVTGEAIRVDRRPGAGAAGGLGYGLMLLGGHRVSGVEAILSAVRFPALLADADLVVTGEGRFDWQSLRGKVVSGVAQAASGHGIPVVVIAGQVAVGRREAMAVGANGVYAVAEKPEQVPAALADPAGRLADRAERVARTWSPTR